VYALQKYPFITVFPVHALSLYRYRQAFSPSGAKDEPQDAELASELMLRYPQKIKASEPDNADIRLLQQLVEQRRQLIEDKRCFVNRISSLCVHRGFSRFKSTCFTSVLCR